MLLEPERLSIGVSEIGFSELETCSGSNSCFRLPGVLICLWASIPQIIGVVKSAKLQFLRITIELVKKTRLYSGKTFEKMILKNGGPASQVLLVHTQQVKQARGTSLDGLFPFTRFGKRQEIASESV